MTYRRTYNRHEAWQQHCRQYAVLIEKLQLPDWVFASEQNFRQFATTGELDAASASVFCFDQLDDALFWDLFDFIQTYFDMGATLFNASEQARLGR